MMWKTIRLGGVLVVAVGIARSFPTRSMQPSASPNPDVYQCFGLRTEALEPVPDGRIMLVGGSLPTVQQANAMGITPAVQRTVGQVYDVYLRRKSLAVGQVLGQTIRNWYVPYPAIAIPPEVTHPYSETFFTQPVLRPVTLDSAADIVNEPNDNLWVFYRNDVEGDGFCITANVGSLSSAKSVQRYLDYVNIALGATDYRYALAVQTQDSDSFGETATPAPAAIFDIDASSFGFDETPVIDFLFIPERAADSGTSAIEYAASWGPTQGGVGHRIWIGLRGSFGRGTSLFLVRPGGGNPADSFESLASPPNFPPPVASTGGSYPASVCIPSPPSCPDTVCVPSTPSSGCNQPATPNGFPSIPAQDFNAVGDIQCGTPLGGTIHTGGTTQWSGSASVEFELGGVNIEGGGDFETTETTSFDAPLGPGAHGCGQCAQLYHLRCVVRRHWIVEKAIMKKEGWPHPIDIFTGECVDEEKVTACSKAFSIPRVCDIQAPCD